MEHFPKHIKFLSDSTEVEFEKEEKSTKDRMATYRYVKCHPDGGLIDTTVLLSLSQIESLLSSHLIEVK